MTRPDLGFDIFCRVVDNFGDIGVCWRLAKQLANRPESGPIRLWVDNTASFAQIEPTINAGAPRQTLGNIELLHWTDPAPAVVPHKVVIEAFACTPPASFISSMQQRGSLWINLEYLSAETWIEGCHALPSLQANGLKKYFFFPGFTEKTGGLQREPGLASVRARWLSRPQPRQRLMREIGMPEPLMERLATGWRQVCLFCYPQAPVDAMVKALSSCEQPTVVIVPQGVLSDATALQSKKLQVFEAPFVDQNGFDRLLWSSDLNIVRGEDSLVRAIWAGKPFIWHAYPQEGDAHMDKLNAWLAQARFPAMIDALMRAWNINDAPAVLQGLQQALQPEAWSTWRCDTANLTRRLASQSSLVERLLAFSAEKTRNG